MLINSLVLQEAKASSEIKNIVTTNDALFRAMASGSGAVDPATKEVLRYREALWQGFHRVKKGARMSPALFVELVRAITEDPRGIRDEPGTLIGNLRTRKIIYTPPEGANVIRKMLADLETFLHARNGLDPLIKMALAITSSRPSIPSSTATGAQGVSSIFFS